MLVFAINCSNLCYNHKTVLLETQMETESISAQIHKAAENGDTDFFRSYLHTKCSAKVEKRIVEISLGNGHPHIVDLFVGRDNAHSNIALLALCWSIANGKQQWVQHFVNYEGVLDNQNDVLKLAIQTRNQLIIDTILTHVSSANSEVLCAAVRTTDINVVRKILPMCNPKDQSSSALQEAVAFQNQEIFDLLYPLSDPQEAWECIRKDSWFDARQRKMIKSRLDVDRQKAKLEKAIGSEASTVKIKKI